MVHREGGEVGQRPSSANAAAREDAVGRLELEPDAAAQQREAYGESAEHFSARSPRLQFVGEEESQANDKDSDADFIEPVRAEGLFE